VIAFTWAALITLAAIGLLAWTFVKMTTRKRKCRDSDEHALCRFI